MPDTPTAPSAEEIGAAIALLRGIPGVTEQHTLEDIAEISTPLVQLAHSLAEWLNDHHSRPDAGQIASVLDTLATEHGLHITTDPGDLLGYLYYVKDAETRQWYPKPDRTWMADGLDNARRYGAPGARLAAVYLLPEGGQA